MRKGFSLMRRNTDRRSQEAGSFIANSIMASFGMPKGELPSGLKDFTFTNYE